MDKSEKKHEDVLAILLQIKRCWQWIEVLKSNFLRVVSLTCFIDSKFIIVILKKQVQTFWIEIADRQYVDPMVHFSVLQFETN